MLCIILLKWGYSRNYNDGVQEWGPVANQSMYDLMLSYSPT